MAGKTASFLALGWNERWLFAQALVLLPIAALALRAMPFGRLRSLLDRPMLNASTDHRARASRIAHMVAAAGAYGPYRATCVPQSVVLQWLLRREGIRGEMRYGVRKADGAVSAHCWIELDGEPLIDSPAVRDQFAVLDPPAAASPWRR